jgi:putative acetyltransferase
VIVRPEEPADREASIAVELAAFAGTDEASIVEAVRDEAGSFALVAEDDAAIVGHIQFSAASIGDDEVLALGPIAVLPERQGEGIGRALMEVGIEEARARGAVAVILLGDPALYGRFGFGPGADHGLTNPFAGIQEDGFVIEEEHFQILPLDERVRGLKGPVRWHPAFE